MSRKAGPARAAFSLLEVIIATAILAGSAIVLFSLISLGTKYGNRAEERTIAISQAQSVLDEFVARISVEEIREEVIGVLPSTPSRSFRIEVTPFDPAGNRGADPNGQASNGIQTVLYRVRVKLFESNAAVNEDSEPMFQLSRLVRRPRINDSSDGGIRSESSRLSANRNRANRISRGNR